MSPITILESGLTFGPFDDNDCFCVEQSALYAGIGEGVKMVEFMLIRPGSDNVPKLLCVEAKSSAPRPTSEADFERYFDDIREKMSNAVSLYIAARVGRHGTAGDEMPPGLKTPALEAISVSLILVVSAAEEDWLPPLQDKLRQVLGPVVRTFALGPTAVAVLSATRARGARLIT